MSSLKSDVRGAKTATLAREGALADAEAWRELGLDALIAGEPGNGLWFLRNAVEIDADCPETWQLMGRCFEELGEATRARSCFLLAFRQHASSASINASLSATLALSWRRRPNCDV